jgi:multiple sugar transport system substrate-binding protein
MMSILKLGAALALATGASSIATAQSVTINLATAPSIYQKAFEGVVSSFETAHPEIKVNLIPAVREDEELVQRTLRSAIMGDVPDVLFISPNLMRPIIDRNLAVPLKSLGATSEELASLGLVPGAEGVGAVSGTLYGLPLGVSTPIIAYNADLVDQAGAMPNTFPKTWPEAVSLVKKITALGSGAIGGYFEYDNTGNWTYKALVATLGGSMMTSDDKSITFDNPAGREALDVLRGFGEGGQSSVDMTRDQARQAFAAGKIGLLVTSSGALPGLEKQVAGKFSLKAAPLPLGLPGGRVPAAGTVIMILAKDDAKKKAAWELAKYAVGPDAQTLIGKQTGLISVNREALADPRRLADQVRLRPNQQAALDQLSRLGEWYAFPGENSIKITSIIKGYLQAVLTLRLSPEDALAQMKRDVAALLPK